MTNSAWNDIHDTNGCKPTTDPSLTVFHWLVSAKSLMTMHMAACRKLYLMIPFML